MVASSTSPVAKRNCRYTMVRKSGVWWSECKRSTIRPRKST
jgi:hypothetical protein